MEPAKTIISKLGGPTKVGKMLGVNRVTVNRWYLPRRAGGTDGRIPLNHHRALLRAAQELGEHITAEDLLPPDADVCASENSEAH